MSFCSWLNEHFEYQGSIIPFNSILLLSSGKVPFNPPRQKFGLRSGGWVVWWYAKHQYTTCFIACDGAFNGLSIKHSRLPDGRLDSTKLIFSIRLQHCFSLHLTFYRQTYLWGQVEERSLEEL